MKIPNVLTFVLAGLLAVGLMAGCSGSTEEDAMGERSATTGDRPAASGDVAGETGVSVGDYPPSFTLPDLDGNDVSLSDFEGKVVVLDLWATWCPPCREEIPFLIELHNEFGDQGLAIVGVGLDQGGASDLAPFVRQNGIDYTIVVGNRSISEAYRVSGIPTTFILGRDGRIAAKHVGFANELRPEMRSEIEMLLGEAENI